MLFFLVCYLLWATAVAWRQVYYMHISLECVLRIIASVLRIIASAPLDLCFSLKKFIRYLRVKYAQYFFLHACIQLVFGVGTFEVEELWIEMQSKTNFGFALNLSWLNLYVYSVDFFGSTFVGCIFVFAFSLSFPCWFVWTVSFASYSNELYFIRNGWKRFLSLYRDV